MHLKQTNKDKLKVPCQNKFAIKHSLIFLNIKSDVIGTWVIGNFLSAYRKKIFIEKPTCRYTIKQNPMDRISNIIQKKKKKRQTMILPLLVMKN